MRCGLCGFLIIKPQTALHRAMWSGAVQFMRFSYYKTANRTAPCDVERCGAVQCTITCGAVWLCHFAGGFGMIFTVCAVYAVW